MAKLQIIVGSTRPTRAVDLVVPWVLAQASAHKEFEVELLDLRDWPLPIFAEHLGSIGDRNDPTYSDPIVKRWNQKIKEGDAYLVITPEYNHSVPGVLKNAIDSVFVSFAFRNKPIGFIGYSGGIAGGVRVIEHLALIAIEADMHPLRNSVVIPFVTKAFDESGSPLDPMAKVSLDIVLEDLEWWGKLLVEARKEGALPPGQARMFAGMEALAK